jgi:hypothetical protein
MVIQLSVVVAVQEHALSEVFTPTVYPVPPEAGTEALYEERE